MKHWGVLCLSEDIAVVHGSLNLKLSSLLRTESQILMLISWCSVLSGFPALSHGDSHIDPGQSPAHETLQQNWTFCLVFGRTKFGRILCSK